MTNKTNHVFILAMALLMLIGCTSKEMKKAKEFMDASMYEQAIALLEIEIQDNPKNAEASFLLGKCYLQTSNNEKVEDCFKRAILLDTDFKESIGNIYFEKSIEFYKKDNFNYANSYYEKGVKYNPAYKDDFAKQLFDYTSEFSETATETVKPISLFTIIDQISPNYKSKIAEKTFILAKSFIDKGFITEGFEYADFGIKYDSKHIKDVADLYFNYANDLLTVQNKPNDCISFFDRCIVLNPDMKIKIGNIYYNQAKTFETNNKINLLLIFAKKSVEINSEYESWYIELKEKYKPKIPKSGLVVYFPFNGNGNDESGNGLNGFIHGATNASDRFGNSQGAVYFDGVNDYMSTNNSDAFLFKEQFTISFWLKTNSRGYDERWVFKNNPIPNRSWYLGFWRSYPGKMYFFSSGDGRNSKQFASNSRFNDNKWHLVVFIYNGKKNYVAFFKDGKIDAENYHAFSSLNQNNQPLLISRNNNKANGTIDDLRIYNRVLTNGEIQLLFNENK